MHATIHSLRRGPLCQSMWGSLRLAPIIDVVHANCCKFNSEFAVAHLHDNFDDVIWSDETTVRLETHHHFCYRKEGANPRLKPRPKHPIKLHVWAGISKKGPTAACIFEGIMDATLPCLSPFFFDDSAWLVCCIKIGLKLQ